FSARGQRPVKPPPRNPVNAGSGRFHRSLPFFFFLFFFVLILLLTGVRSAGAATVDLVVDIISDQPAYMSFDLEHFTVTVSNNGPDPATSVALSVNHPLA